MALKLKLSLGGSSSPQPPTPKLKIKPPKADGVKKHRHEKTKKLKISLSNKTPQALAAPEEAPAPAPRVVPKVRIKPTRIPGDGYDSEAPDVEDDPLVEQAIAIRFLPDANLDFVHLAVETGDLSNVNIKWLTRDKAVVNVNLTLYLARLVDLPTLTELYKTVDKKNLFKTIDVSQILLVLHPINPQDLNAERDFDISPDRLYVHPLYELLPGSEIVPSRTVLRDGLLYPYQDVYRRFKPRKVGHRVLHDVDSRVNDLIKRDNDAEETHYEMADARKAVNTAAHRFGTPSGTPSSVASPTAHMPADDDMGPDLEDEALEQELAEALQGGDDDEKGDFMFATQLAGDGEGATDDVEGLFGAEDDDDDDDDDEDDEEDDDDDDDESKEGRMRAKYLEEEITELESVIANQRQALASATNKMMKMKFQANYSTLRGQLEAKRRELSQIRDDQQKLQEKVAPNHALEATEEHVQADEHSLGDDGEGEDEGEMEIEDDGDDGEDGAGDEGGDFEGLF